MSGTGWALSPGTTSRKEHWFSAGRSYCGKFGDLGVEEYRPDDGGPKGPDDCAACFKRVEVDRRNAERSARSSEPTPVITLHVRVPPGGLACPSSVHAGQQVRATVEGMMTGVMLAGDRQTFCDWCALLLERFGWFIPDETSEVCVRCMGASAPVHAPACCEKPFPHGRPLCCHCYGLVHQIGGRPCH